MDVLLSTLEISRRRLFVSSKRKKIKMLGKKVKIMGLSENVFLLRPGGKTISVKYRFSRRGI